MFITFEGTEGSGKSSQIDALAVYLRQRGYDVLATREPGGTSISEQVRAVLSNLDNAEMHPRTETLLFQGRLVDRSPSHLAGGGELLSDRYADSTLAYQGYGHQQDLVQLRALLAYVTGGLAPDLTLLFDLSVEEGLRRKAKGGEWNRLDAYGTAFYQRVRDGYYQLAREEPGRWVFIDAAQPPGAVQAAVRRVVGERLGIAGET
jgi:dTMP kinase